MKVQLISVIALAMTTTTGFAHTQLPTDPAPTTVVTPQDDDFAPQTRSERVGAYVTGTFGDKALAESAVQAGIGTLRHSPKEWSGSITGFGPRMAANFAQHVVRGTLQHGAAALLHEDNRYRPATRKGFWKRSKYAVASTFLARHDNGRRGFAFSRIGSAAGASFIARAWLPRSIATVGAGASSFGLSIAADVGVNMLREFWPDLKHRLLRRK
jgi:hypothetical protein